ncbi:hypothetical protein Ruko_01550 [Ruthenibacterium sp. TH_2024_36131]
MNKTTMNTQNDIISNRPYTVENGVIVVERPKEDLSGLPKNTFRVSSRQKAAVK